MVAKAEVRNVLKQNTSFLTQVFKKSIVACMLSILSVNINVFVDGILVGNKIGADALAAINLSLPLYLLLCVVGSFIASGTAINAAHEMGRDNMKKCGEYYCTCVVMLIVSSIIITIIGLAFREELVSFLCSDPNVRGYVMEYVVITLIGTLPKIMIYAPFWYLRLDGKNFAVTIMMIVMTVGNIILDILFVYFMNMGVFGAGLASVIATAVSVIIGFIYLFSKTCQFNFRWYSIANIKEWKGIISAGTPSALNNLLATVRLLIINTILMKIGGSAEVAVFAVVNGIAGFGECITLGIPQAASAMLGVYCGEKDNGSCRLLVKIEAINCLALSIIFFVATIVLSGFIRNIYCVQQSMLIPLLWLALSIFPAALLNVISGYYNMAEKSIWSNAIIIFRMVVMTFVGLLLVEYLNFSTYSFLLTAEIGTGLLWILAAEIYHRKKPKYSRIFFMNNSLEKKQKVINFSVEATDDAICEASEKISDFCANNGLDRKKTMTVQLAMEEVMTLIKTVNQQASSQNVCFDVRCYSISGVNGIRLRYAGEDINPFMPNQDLDMDMMMGIRMVEKLVELTKYQRTFGVNTLQIILKDDISENNIRNINEGDIEAVKELTDENIGIDFYTKDYILATLDAEDKNFYVYESGGDEIGAYIYTLYKPLGEALEFLGVPKDIKELQNEDPKQKVCVSKTAITHKKHRGEGLFNLMVNYIANVSEKSGCSMIISVAIKTPEGNVPVKKQVEEMEFISLGTMEKPWKLIKSYCPYCKKDYCECDGVIYIKRLKNNN